MRRIAEFAEEVHSFDVEPPSLEPPPNATIHTGDSHELLPAYLAELAEAGRNVDFALVDVDHTALGIRADVGAMLNSPSVSNSVLLIHDTANEEVRRGLDAIHFEAFPKVAYVDLDFVPGHVCQMPELRNEIWYGLGLVVIDASAAGLRRLERDPGRFTATARARSWSRASTRRRRFSPRSAI